MTNALECRHLGKIFTQNPVINDLSLSVEKGAFLTLLGPSGCGKTTTLRLIAGFENPDSGEISIAGQTVATPRHSLAPEKRRVGMVFQDYALFPHINVAKNIAFGLQGDAQSKQRRVDEMLELVDLSGLGKRMPYELSGGQQQRVALARALAPDPAILLLDEPFSNLDTALRAQVRAQVRSILQQAGSTAIFVTHDQEEALSLSDKVAVLFDGHLAQLDSPAKLYHQPANSAVAAFIGEANLLDGQANGDRVDCALGQLPLEQALNGPVEVLIRPENILLSENGTAPNATVQWREFYGHDQRIGIQLHNGTQLIARSGAEQHVTPGQSVYAHVNQPVRAFTP
jgi:iron(III) transport system ATP-binding protein